MRNLSPLLMLLSVLFLTPELKRFVKYGGADSFENVEVEFQKGKKAILIIYHDGDEREQVELQAIPTYQEMRDMMLEKGFQLKAPEEVARITQEGDAAFEEDMEGRRKRQEQSRERMNKFKTGSASTGGDSNGAASTIQDALKKMKDSGVKITAEMIRKLEEEHKEQSRIDQQTQDVLPAEEQISKEQMREWKLQQWKEIQEQRKLANVEATGDEL
ncbi:Sep15/SelM redox domain containing protein [Nitzschia inconspicua]|uniref:Sep15/SelM redox domain containing protein n=1 Tax=Nitzschia inconspicua TaxID=303405 RepID=A0A9K3KR43_9STRA|nr:Sep15/SelM redox domain containing protein [Nitzschia inconspicua]